MRGIFGAGGSGEQLRDAAARGVAAEELALPAFDLKAYLEELRRSGKRFVDSDEADYGDDVEDICQGWRFAIAGKPQLYEDRDALAAFIVEHGGTVDESMNDQTDFLIYCGEGSAGDPSDGPLWLFGYADDPQCVVHRGLSPREVKPFTYWGRYQGSDDELVDMEAFSQAFEPMSDYFDRYYDSPVDSGYSAKLPCDLSSGDFVIPETEFVRRFDPERDMEEGVEFTTAYPALLPLSVQVCKRRGIDPKDLRTLTGELGIFAMGDSRRELGIIWEERDYALDLDTGKSSFHSDYDDYVED